MSDENFLLPVEREVALVLAAGFRTQNEAFEKPRLGDVDQPGDFHREVFKADDTGTMSGVFSRRYTISLKPCGDSGRPRSKDSGYSDLPIQSAHEKKTGKDQKCLEEVANRITTAVPR